MFLKKYCTKLLTKCVNVATNKCINIQSNKRTYNLIHLAIYCSKTLEFSKISKIMNQRFIG